MKMLSGISILQLLHQKKASTFFRAQAKSSGYTVTELLISMAIGIILTVIIGVFYLLIVSSTSSQVVRIQALEESNVAILALNNYLSRAINIERAASTENLGLYVATGTEGKIKVFRTADTKIDDIETLGIFVSDMSGPTTAANSYFAVGIFYARPTPQTQGVLFIDKQSLTAPGAMSLGPSYSKAHFGNLVEFEILDTAGTPEEMRIKTSSASARPLIQELTVRLVTRVFIDSRSTLNHWCPRADITAGVEGCENPNGFEDVTSTFRIQVQNNLGPIVNPQNLLAPTIFSIGQFAISPGGG